MPVSSELMLALLSMDSYSRGYAEGIGGLGGIGAQIGNATLTGESDVAAGSAAVTAGFYASAYNWSGQTVISYRGTDDKVLDTLYGYGVGAGLIAPQGFSHRV